jgi:hypothetical protein
MPSLSTFMLNLAKNPEAGAAFKQNPGQAMANAGLAPSDISAVLSKNPTLIVSAVSASAKAENAAEGVTVVVVIT